MRETSRLFAAPSPMLLRALLVLAVLGLFAPAASPVAAAAQTTLSASTVNLANVGDTATITITVPAPGVAANTVAAQFDALFDPTMLAVSGTETCPPAASGGIWGAGATAVPPVARPDGARMLCFQVTPVSATSGTVMTFVIQRLAGFAQNTTTPLTLSTDPARSQYGHSDTTTEPIGTTNTLTINASAPPATATNTPTATSTPTNTPTRTNTPTITPTPTATPAVTATFTPQPSTGLTQAQALAQAQALGLTPGNGPCAPVGGTCAGNQNGLNARGTVVSSMTWNITATLPIGPAAGTGLSFFVVTTTAGPEAVPCAPIIAVAPAPGSLFACTTTTAGTALQGAAAFLVFPGVGGAPGPVVGPAIITGVGVPAPAPVVPPAAALTVPLLPPLLPPPPPPFLPPPPLLPPFAAGGPPQQVTRPAVLPEVPVIPEADSVALLAVGLLATGAAALWRRSRRPN